jgi:hypothetical protein
MQDKGNTNTLKERTKTAGASVTKTTRRVEHVHHTIKETPTRCSREQ